MPLVRISLRAGKPQDYRNTIGDVIHNAMVDQINCPPMDRFQLLTEHKPGNFLHTSNYLGIPYSDDLIIIQITLNEGRSVELKKNLFKAIAEGLNKTIGVSMEDVLINLVEVPKENWSFGLGCAQYAP